MNYLLKNVMRKRVFIVILPVTIIVYSILISVFLFNKKIDFIISATNLFEILIPLILGLIFAVQFYLFNQKIKMRREENEQLVKQLNYYKTKVNQLKINRGKIREELQTELYSRDYNYFVIKLSFLIEKELQRLTKDKKQRNLAEMIKSLSIDEKISPEITQLLYSIINIRNKAIHGVNITKIEMKNYSQLAEIVLSILRKLR